MPAGLEVESLSEQIRFVCSSSSNEEQVEKDQRCIQKTRK